MAAGRTSGYDTDRGGQGEAVAAGLAELSGWAAALAWRDVPEPSRRQVARLFADDLAAIVAARSEPELGALTARIARASGPAEATVFDGSGRRLDRYSAALANGSAADWCELDGGYRKALCHAGLYCLPAVLAEGEAAGCPLEEMLRALLIGYETVSRVARTFERSDLALHPHGSIAAVGAAAAVAALRGHEPDTAAAAISTAATMVAPGRSTTRSRARWYETCGPASAPRPGCGRSTGPRSGSPASGRAFTTSTRLPSVRRLVRSG